MFGVACTLGWLAAGLVGELVGQGVVGKVRGDWLVYGFGG